MNRLAHRFFSLLFFLIGLFPSILIADNTSKRPAYNTFSVDVPVDGGVMLSVSRNWRLTRFLDAGWVLAGGQIQREFDVNTANAMTFKAETEALVLPLTGPYVTLHYEWIGISLGYAAFLADTDITMKNDATGTLSGNKKGWGTGFYSPLLVLDFYDRKHDLVFGFGLGGYFGTSYPNLTASAPGISVTTDESPIDTLTFHLRLLWSDGRQQRVEKRQHNDDDL